MARQEYALRRLDGTAGRVLLNSSIESNFKVRTSADGMRSLT